jgi:hypothetical protein
MSGAGPVAGQPHPCSAPTAGVTGEAPAARAGRPVRRHPQTLISQCILRISATWGQRQHTASLSRLSVICQSVLSYSISSYKPVSIDLDRVFTDATELSRTHTAKFLTRSLDLLHVAAAHVMECTTFVSANNRQLAVAKAAGLVTTDIKRRAR